MQVAQPILENPEDKTKIHLIHANRHLRWHPMQGANRYYLAEVLFQLVWLLKATSQAEEGSPLCLSRSSMRCLSESLSFDQLIGATWQQEMPKIIVSLLG